MVTREFFTTQRSGYAKTREVYVAYRKAGYSAKFRQEHESEILLHRAAKDSFDNLGVKKLPKMKELQAEYAKLLEEKKKNYAEYRHSREEMRELLAAKANVDRILNMEAEHDPLSVFAYICNIIAYPPQKKKPPAGGKHSGTEIPGGIFRPAACVY